VTLAPTEEGPHRVLSIVAVRVCPEKRNRIVRGVVLEDDRKRSAAKTKANIA
jgi:hypothetical protein